jgi:prepilin-type N-terminal cleavage/methylation domain-containing protein
MVTRNAMHKTARGFTIIELIVAAAVIGIISAVVTANLAESRARARDVNRTEAVRNYSAAIEQWKSSNGNFFVYLKGGVVPNCSFNPDGNKFMSCTGSSSVGFQGSGEGGITRKKLNGGDVNPANYTTSSIADALLTGGYLSQIRLDPNDTAFNTNTNANSDHSDFILVLCKADSAPADSIKNAQEYAIFTQLERPDNASQAVADTHCGGTKTPSGGWNTLIAR